jgi:hypothetical protein
VNIHEYAQRVMATVPDAATESQRDGQLYALLILTAALGGVSGILQNHYYVGKPWDTETYEALKDALCLVVRAWAQICGASGINPEEILYRSIGVTEDEI